MRAVGSLLLLTLVLQGCLSAETEVGPSWRFRGTFTMDFTDADVQAVCEAVREGNPHCEMMQSLPPQFGGVSPTRGGCEAMREKVLAVPHVTGVSGCAPDTSPRGP